jgi:hypothetical protein
MSQPRIEIWRRCWSRGEIEQAPSVERFGPPTQTHSTHIPMHLKVPDVSVGARVWEFHLSDEVFQRILENNDFRSFVIMYQYNNSDSQSFVNFVGRWSPVICFETEREVILFKLMF